MWNSTQCAVQGRGHIKSGTPCQDKTFLLCAGGVTAAVLADGAGSAKLSHFGAETAVRCAAELAAERFDRYFANEDAGAVKKDILGEVRRCLEQKAEELHCEMRDLASTLLLAAVKEDRFLLVHIGDGVIGYLKNRELKIASEPLNGEFANTTVFTTSRDALGSMKILKGRLGEISGFVLMSDGTETAFYQKKEKKLADVLKKIMQWCIFMEPEALARNLDESFRNVVRQVTMDDCSMAMLVNDQEQFHGYLRLSGERKCQLLGLPEATSGRQLRRYDDILRCLQKRQSLRDLSRQVHLKPLYLRKYVGRLSERALIEQDRFQNSKTIVILER